MKRKSLIVLLYETVINVLWIMSYKMVLNTMWFFWVNFNGNKKDLFKTAKINLDRSRGTFGTLYQPPVTLKLKVGVFRF